MNKFATLFINDLKNTRRDPTLLILMCLPVLMLFVIRFGIPFVEQLYPPVEEFSPLLITGFAILTAAFPAFVISFMMLDEQDQNVLTAIRVSPLSNQSYLFGRLLFIIIFGWINATFLLQYNGKLVFQWSESLALALLCVSVSPTIVFCTLLLAKNKIEGVTIMKFANMSILLPVIAQFIDGSLRYIFAIFPAFWVYETSAHIANSSFINTWGIGLLSVIVLNFLLFKLTMKRLFR